MCLDCYYILGNNMFWKSPDFDKKLEVLKNNLEGMHVVSDFDRTLTVNNERIISMISLLRGHLEKKIEEYKKFYDDVYIGNDDFWEKRLFE